MSVRAAIEEWQPRRLAAVLLCAWVLWGTTGSAWIPLGGEESKDACEQQAVMKRLATGQLVIRPLDDFLAGKPSAQAPPRKSGDPVFMCLPGTIDPRPRN